MQVKHTHLCGFKATNDTFISRAKLFRKVGFGSIITFSLLTLAIISPIYIKFSGVEAVSGTANPSTTTLSLNVVDNLLSLDLSPTSSYGTFASSSPASIQVSTNNVSGYTLSIKSSVVDTSNSNAVSNATNLVNTVDSTKVISSISTATSSSAFSTNTNTQYNNKWGYLPSKLNSLNNTNYLPSPSYNEATILNTTTCANGITSASCTTSATDTYTITLGARVDSTLPTGSYEHDFVLIAVGNPINYSITYHANDGADGADTTNMPTPNPQTGNASSDTTSINLSTTKPRRQGYELKGWCSVVPTADSTYPDDQNCTGEGAVLYQPGAAYGIDQTTTNIVDLYATWWQPNLTKLNESHATMQQMSPMACYNSAIGDTATLTDNRDGTTKSYTVAKLADNNCWMTTNLNLGTDHDITLTADDTDLAENTTFTLPASNSAFKTGVTTAQLYNGDNNDGNYNGTYYGGYYSWAVSIARTTALSSGNATTSICPKNWDLPTQTQYANLKTKGSLSNYSNASVAPYNFTYGGYRNGSNFTSQTSRGDLWTSTAYNRSYAYANYITSSAFATAGSGTAYYKDYGRSVRCVAGNGTATINYDGNGTTEYPVTGTTTSQVDVEINSTMTRANGFTRTGWYFNGWNTKADGSGIAIAANVASTTPLFNLNLADGDTITLYAQWLPQFIITYVNNCKAWAASDTNCTDSKSATTSEQKANLTNNPSTGTEIATLGAYNKFTMTGWKIKEWTTNADGTGTSYPVASTYTVPAGSGAGSGITLYAHWVPIYAVQYDGNGADNASTGMGVANATTGIKAVNHTNVAEGDTFDLFASNFKRTGYGFVGWSTDSDAWSKLTDNDTSNDAKIWGPNEVITAPAPNGTPITTLYAIWAPAEKTNPSDPSSTPVYLQDWEGCSSMTATTYNTTTGKLTVAKNTITALTDKRDNMVYTIAKLADGNCWMVENLRLDNGATVGNNINDSSVTNQSLAQGYGGVFNGLADPESTNFSEYSTTPNSLYTTDANSTTLNIITGNGLDRRFPRYNNTNITWNNNASSATTPTAPSQNITSANAHQDYNNYVYSYGNYYTWASAIADTGEYNNLSAHPNSSTSICPSGWHLPNGNNGTNSTSDMGGLSGGFSYLDKQMDGTGSYQNTSVAPNKWRMFPNNFIYSGGWNGSSAYGRGGYGYYWSSSASNASYAFDSAYYLSFGRSNVYPGTADSYKGRGFTVRCVAGGGAYTIVYDGNGATAGSMTANGVEIKYTGVHEGDTINLYAPNYKKDGYGFVGWSPSPTATVGGSAPIYGPNETITAPSYETYKSAPRQVTLYAIWMAKDTTNTMQTFNSSNRCTSMPQATYSNGTITVPSGSIIALEDERDGNVYTIAKLVDGNCWMTENLRLNNEATITTSNTHNPLNTNGTVNLKIDYANNTIADHLASTNDTWCNSYGASCFDQTMLNTNNTNLGGKNASGTDLISTPGYPINSGTSGQQGSTFSWYSYGNYYNWYSATAGNGTYSKTSGNVDGDLCPTGWHLPYGASTNTGNTAGGFYYLNTKMANDTSTQGSKDWRSFPNNFIYSGVWSDSSAYDRGGYGLYWSSSAYNSTAADYLVLGSSYVDPGTSVDDKLVGYTVRCVAGGSGS